MYTTWQLGVAGALGRMGRAVTRAAEARRDVAVVARYGSGPGPGLTDRTGTLARSEVVIDFTNGAASADLARLAAKNGGPSLVIGSTGFTPAQEEAILSASERVAILRSGNFSLGVNMLIGLVAQATAILRAKFENELPPVLSGLDATGIQAECRKAIDEVLRALHGS